MRYPEKQKLYKPLRQSEMESRLNVTQIATMLTKTKDTMAIHSKEYKEMLTPTLKIREQWRSKHQAILEQPLGMTTARKKQYNDKYANDAAKTEITQLIAQRQEMPEALGLNRDGRGELAEIMREYPPCMPPTRTSRPRIGTKRTETNRHMPAMYQILRKPIRGRNRLKNPEFQQAPPKRDLRAQTQGLRQDI